MSTERLSSFYRMTGGWISGLSEESLRRMALEIYPPLRKSYIEKPLPVSFWLGQTKIDFAVNAYWRESKLARLARFLGASPVRWIFVISCSRVPFVRCSSVTALACSNVRLVPTFAKISYKTRLPCCVCAAFYAFSMFWLKSKELTLMGRGRYIYDRGLPAAADVC